ncbi:unnamed protein product [Choristocarpus tenellus]
MAAYFSRIMSVLHILLVPASRRHPSSEAPIHSAAVGISTDGGSVGFHRRGSVVPPDVVKQSLGVLDEADRSVGLFRFPPFFSMWLESFLENALLGLGEGEQPTLREELGGLVFRLAKVDHETFARKFLPCFLGTFYPRLGLSQRDALAAPWQAGSHLDAPTFSSHLEAFLNDLAFLQSQQLEVATG